MRISKSNGPLNVQAISGTYVVLLGMNMSAESSKGLLGFSICRTDHTENEKYWLKSFKTFKETDPNPAPGSLVSTQENPIQGFHWGDYTAKPNHQYSYEVVPVYGIPKNLKPGPSVLLDVSTQNEDQGRHAVYFNRGVAGSQAFARKFPNADLTKSPDPDALAWLSRGLVEAMLAYIGRAKGKKFSLRAAVYEFNYLPVLQAFGAAAKTGADVKIVYDARKGKGKPVAASQAAIKAAKIQELVIPRTANPSYIAHNKFIVLLVDGKPTEVWTGSTNFTAGGIFGHSNVGHIVRDENTAQAYLDYWDRLSQDPLVKDLAPENLSATPTPQGTLAGGALEAAFSPRPDLGILEWYAAQMDKQKNACFTAAFGVNELLAKVLAKQRDYLRYILLDQPGKTYSEFSRVKNNEIAVGAVLDATDDFQRWLSEHLTGLNAHVPYLHTKYLLLDPLGDNPTVISGSANFSDASTLKNDENMVLIQGNKDVADIYLGEFMRLFDHYFFRDYANQAAKGGKKPTYDPAHLASDDSWAKPYFISGSAKELIRNFFCP